MDSQLLRWLVYKLWGCSNRLYEQQCDGYRTHGAWRCILPSVKSCTDRQALLRPCNHGHEKMFSFFQPAHPDTSLSVCLLHRAKVSLSYITTASASTQKAVHTLKENVLHSASISNRRHKWDHKGTNGVHDSAYGRGSSSSQEWQCHGVCRGCAARCLAAGWDQPATQTTERWWTPGAGVCICRQQQGDQGGEHIGGPAATHVDSEGTHL